MNMSIFRRSRIAVESNTNRNFDHFHRSRMRRGIVVSWSYRSRIAIVITALTDHLLQQTVLKRLSHQCYNAFGWVTGRASGLL